MSTAIVQPHAAESVRLSAPPNASKPPVSLRNATDDEILASTALASSVRLNDQLDSEWEKGSPDVAGAQATPKPSPSNLEAIFAANPELRQAWEEASAYRESFATPEAAREATAALADLNRMDALFFSPRAEDHAELARAVAALDPAAFKSLARAMTQLTASEGSVRAAETSAPVASPTAETNSGPVPSERGHTVRDKRSVDASDAALHAPLTAPQETFFHRTNESTVRAVIDAIESQVQRLLPQGTSKGAANRLVGEIYRELDSTLRSNRQLAQQVRESFRSGNLDDEHQAAVVSLILGRTRQALPAVAKRVLNEWTSTVVAANHDRQSRQRAAERRVDIAGSGRTGNDGHRPLAPRDVDYARMSDSDILNL